MDGISQCEGTNNTPERQLRSNKLKARVTVSRRCTSAGRESSTNPHAWTQTGPCRPEAVPYRHMDHIHLHAILPFQMCCCDCRTRRSAQVETSLPNVKSRLMKAFLSWRWFRNRKILRSAQTSRPYGTPATTQQMMFNETDGNIQINERRNTSKLSYLNLLANIPATICHALTFFFLFFILLIIHVVTLKLYPDLLL